VSASRPAVGGAGPAQDPPEWGSGVAGGFNLVAVRTFWGGAWWW
jgi:hypothetical protein